MSCVAQLDFSTHAFRAQLMFRSGPTRHRKLPTSTARFEPCRGSGADFESHVTVAIGEPWRTVAGTVEHGSLARPAERGMKT